MRPANPGTGARRRGPRRDRPGREHAGRAGAALCRSSAAGARAGCPAARATRCRPIGDGDAPLLSRVVDGQLTRQGIDPDSATWDAGRRDNGTWRITVRYSGGRQSGEAVWVYDPVGQQVRPNDDGARDMLTAMSSRSSSTPEAEARPLSVVRPATAPVATTEAPAKPPAPAAAPPKPVVGPDGEEPAKHVSIPSWDDIVFGVRGRK